MLYLRKIKFNDEELRDITEEFDGYLWAAVDTRRGLITAGDEYLSDLRDALLVERSKPEDIFCAGIDMKTGKVYYPVSINRHNPHVDRDGIPEDFRNRIETLFRYFFEEIPAYKAERSRPRYSKKPTPLSFS